MMLERLQEMQEDLDKNFVMSNKDDYVKKQQFLVDMTKTINEERRAKMTALGEKDKKIKKQMKIDYDGLHNYVDHQIQQNIMYFSPEFKQYMKEFEKLVAMVEVNEQILEKKNAEKQEAQKKKKAKQQWVSTNQSLKKKVT